MKPININDQKPDDRQRCMFYHNETEMWSFGYWYNSGQFFWGDISAYVWDGSVTYWLPEPKKPKETE